MKLKIDSQSVINFEDVGEGPAVVLLHAFPLEHAMWQAQIAALSPHYRVIAPDLRGFGGTSTFAGQPTISRMADDVALLLHALRVTEKLVIGGLSMGGYVSLAFAHKFPQRLKGLILADTRAEGDTPEGKAQRLDMIEVAEEMGAAGVIDKMIPKMFCETTLQNRPDVVENVREIAARQSVTGVSDALRALGTRHDAREWLAQIDAPTLVVVGRDDAITPLAMAQTLEAGIAGARLCVIPEAGHLANLEQPAAFNAALLEFLGAL